MAEAWACQRIRGCRGWNTPPPSPRLSLGKAEAEQGDPDHPKGEGPDISGFTYKQEEGRELVYAQGGNKAMWENNKYFLSIYLFFFFLPFLTFY